MKKSRQRPGFTLLEVIIAVGLFASAVTVILGLLAVITRQGRESSDLMAAQQLPEPLRIELSRLAADGLDNLAARVPVMTSPLGRGLQLAANRDTGRVVSLDYLPLAADSMPAVEQYYLVECWRFTAEPLHFDNGKAFLALQVRVSWPYRLPEVATPTALADREQITFSQSLTR